MRTTACSPEEDGKHKGDLAQDKKGIRKIGGIFLRKKGGVQHDHPGVVAHPRKRPSERPFLCGLPSGHHRDGGKRQQQLIGIQIRKLMKFVDIFYVADVSGIDEIRCDSGVNTGVMLPVVETGQEYITASFKIRKKPPALLLLKGQAFA